MTQHVVSPLLKYSGFDGNRHGLIGPRNATDEDHAIVLSGGGIDSFMSTIAYCDMVPVKKLTFLNIDYGQQSAAAEQYMTDRQVDFFRNTHGIDATAIVINDPLVAYLRNPLANRKDEKAKAGNYATNDDYVPNRNARFVFAAAGLAETPYAGTIILGAVGNVNQDNSLVFLKHAYETIKNSNRDVIPRLYAPFVLFTKSMVALYAEERGLTSQLPKLSTSCFDGNDMSGEVVIQCGECRSCSSLHQAFKFAGVEDPYRYGV